MEKYVIAQTKLPEEVLKKLKEKTGEKTTKEALAKAVEHYIMCVYARPPESNNTKKRRSYGRHPVYLEELIRQYKEMLSVNANE